MQPTSVQHELEQSEPNLLAKRTAVSVALPHLLILRPRQWVKNAFVVAPLLFSGSFLDPASIVNVLITTVVLCVASSAAYVFNDLCDIDSDRLHPVKRYSRPLASGAMSVRAARVTLGVLLAVVGIGLATFPRVTPVVLAYLGLAFAYSLTLKAVPVVDIFVIASGFVLRVWAGAVAIPVALSSWMLITTLCLALYLAAVKRRAELGTAGSEGRLVLTLYTSALLDRFAERAAVAAIVFYGLFVVTVRPSLAYTVPLVLFGLFRYSYLVEKNGGGESPADMVFRDPTLALTVVIWAGLCAYGLWPS